MSDDNTEVKSGKSKSKRTRKVRSMTEGNTIIIKVTMHDGSKRSLTYDFTQIPNEGKDRLALEGACTRLVQFAGGKTGEEAVEGS